MKLTWTGIQMQDRFGRCHLCGLPALYSSQLSILTRCNTVENGANSPPGEEDRHCRSVFVAPREGVGTRSNRRAAG